MYEFMKLQLEKGQGTQTYEDQYLNKLSESKIGDFASPQAFHTFKVEGLGRDKVKSSAEVCSKFEMPISEGGFSSQV